MKYSRQLLIIALIMLAACGKSKKDKAKESAAGDSSNQALYNMVMDIHNEVMPRMEDIYKLKKKLQDTLAHTTAITEEQRLKLEKIISGLDSASNAMMDWMHNFNPLPDSADQEKAREYLETQMESIKKVRELTNEIIEKAKEQSEKK